jgi:hypothetical protein
MTSRYVARSPCCSSRLTHPFACRSFVRSSRLLFCFFPLLLRRLTPPRTSPESPFPSPMWSVPMKRLVPLQGQLVVRDSSSSPLPRFNALQSQRLSAPHEPTRTLHGSVVQISGKVPRSEKFRSLLLIPLSSLTRPSFSFFLPSHNPHRPACSSSSALYLRTSTHTPCICPTVPEVSFSPDFSSSLPFRPRPTPSPLSMHYGDS